jgi:flagellar hook-length control protein FliK
MPQAAQQEPQQNTPQSFHALVSANQTPAQAAVADSYKAASLAQVAQSSVRQGHPASSTEAQALPLNFGPGDTKDTDTQDGARTAVNDTGAADQKVAQASNLASSSSQLPQAVSLQHGAPPVPAPPSLPAATANVPQLPAGTIAQAPASAPEQLTQAAAAALPTEPPAVPLAAPDLNALAISIAAKSLTGAQQFDIRMDPGELGRVDVRLSLDGNGTAQAHLAAERPETLTLLQNNAGTLTRALQDSGVQVANNGLQFSLKGQDRQGDGQPRAASRGRASAAPNIAAAGALNGAAPGYGLSPSGSGVNILV